MALFFGVVFGFSQELSETYQGEQYWFDKFNEELGLGKSNDLDVVVI